MSETTDKCGAMKFLTIVGPKATPNKFYGPGFPTDPVLGILGFIFISDPIPCNFENCKIRFSNSSDIPLDLSLDSTTQHYTLFSSEKSFIRVPMTNLA